MHVIWTICDPPILLHLCLSPTPHALRLSWLPLCGAATTCLYQLRVEMWTSITTVVIRIFLMKKTTKFEQNTRLQIMSCILLVIILNSDKTKIKHTKPSTIYIHCMPFYVCIGNHACVCLLLRNSPNCYAVNYNPAANDLS